MFMRVRVVMGGSSKLDSIIGVHGDLPRHHPHALADRAGLGRVNVRLVVQKLELLFGRWRRGDDFLMLGQFRLAADAGIGRIALGPVCGEGRGTAFRRDHATGPIIGGWAGRQRSGDQIGRGQDAFLKPRILEIAGLGRADRRRARDHNDFVRWRKLHDFAGREQRPGRLLPRHHGCPSHGANLCPA